VRTLKTYQDTRLCWTVSFCSCSCLQETLKPCIASNLINLPLNARSRVYGTLEILLTNIAGGCPKKELPARILNTFVRESVWREPALFLPRVLLLVFGALRPDKRSQNSPCKHAVQHQLLDFCVQFFRSLPLGDLCSWMAESPMLAMEISHLLQRSRD
jgi:hypothetical protein